MAKLINSNRLLSKLHLQVKAFSLLAFSILSGSVFAHHSFVAQYDAEVTNGVTGVLVKVEWLNPHAYFYLDVEDPVTGNVVTWACELGSPVSMLRQGWKREDLVLGETFTVDGNLARDGSPSLNAKSVIVETTGRELFTRQQ
jgi:hypothetical protein